MFYVSWPHDNVFEATLFELCKKLSMRSGLYVALPTRKYTNRAIRSSKWWSEALTALNSFSYGITWKVKQHLKTREESGWKVPKTTLPANEKKNAHPNLKAAKSENDFVNWVTPKNKQRFIARLPQLCLNIFAFIIVKKEIKVNRQSW